MLRPDQLNHPGEKAITNDVWYSKKEYNRRPTASAVDQWKRSLNVLQRAVLYYCFRDNQTLRSNGYRLQSGIDWPIAGGLVYAIGRVLFGLLRVKKKFCDRFNFLTRWLVPA
jgi:hypothetical protein